jgi:hypothetical protein
VTSTAPDLLRPAVDSIIEPARWLIWAVANVDQSKHDEMAWVRARADALAERGEELVLLIDALGGRVIAATRLCTFSIVELIAELAEESVTELHAIVAELPEEQSSSALPDAVGKVRDSMMRVATALTALGRLGRDMAQGQQTSDDVVLRSLLDAPEDDPEDDERLALENLSGIPVTTDSLLLQLGL